MIDNHNEVSFHYAVDDKEIVQGIPENRNAWHSGDGGKYNTRHCHNTSFGWDNNTFYTASPASDTNNNYTRTSIVQNGYILSGIASKTAYQSRVQWTEDSVNGNVQPYIAVYFWRRTK